MTDPDSPPPGPLHRQWRAMSMVFAGGVIGTGLRYAAEMVTPAASGAWPWPTFLVNLAGATILGVLMGYLIAAGPDTGGRQRIRPFFGVGFCGSLTTYSAFALESDRLLAGDSAGLGVGYIACTVIAGIICAGIGFVATTRLRAR